MTPRLDAVGVVVADLGRAVAFYRRLGLEFEPGAETSEHGHAEATGAGVRFMLDTEETVRSFDPGWKRPDGNSIGLAFACDGAEEVDRLYAELVAAGYTAHKEPWDAFWGQRYAQILDPDGHGVDLFAPLS